MRTRDPLRLLRARRRRKRRNKCGNTDSQEELPNHLKNCSLYSQLSPFDCALQNKYFVFILSLRFQLKLKQISIAYLRDVCNLFQFQLKSQRKNEDEIFVLKSTIKR